MRPQRFEFEPLVLAALREDAPWGDLTSQHFIAAETQASADLNAREAGVLCGQDVFTTAMHLVDAGIEAHFALQDGESFAAGQTLASLRGSARSILQAERVALNFVQRLCGISTLTRRFVDAVAGSHARIADTRKTTPTLRLLERYAVRCGGGFNHRYSLSDAVMVKDNHFAALNASSPEEVTAALQRLRETLPHTVHIEVEVDRLDQLDIVLAAGVDTVLLDNFTLADLKLAVDRVAGRALTEASGGVTLDTVAGIAATGVDLISVGALTHSVRSLDLGLDFTEFAPARDTLPPTAPSPKGSSI